MSSEQTGPVQTTMAQLSELVGRHLGFTDWQTMEQSRVNAFADATDDHQWIHVDVERARQSPFGGTIAHGYLTLALVAPIIGQLLTVTDIQAGINYGLDRVRFPAPLAVGSRWRGGLEVAEVHDIPGGVQLKLQVTIEVEGATKPALVAEPLVRLLG
jgi:acyl dehydratase